MERIPCASPYPKCFYVCGLSLCKNLHEMIIINKNNHDINYNF